MKTILVDPKKCVGCGLCATIAPKTFKVNSKGKSEVINSRGNDQELIDEAVSSCPVEAISIGK